MRNCAPGVIMTAQTKPKIKTAKVDQALLCRARGALSDLFTKDDSANVVVELTDVLVVNTALIKLIDIAENRFFPLQTVNKIVNDEKLKTARHLLETLKNAGYAPETAEIFDDPEKGLCLANVVAHEKDPIPAEAVN